MGPADSRKVARAPRYSGYHYASHRCAYAAIMLYGRAFQPVPLTALLATSWPYNPRAALTARVWAAPRSLAATGGIILIFFSCRY